MALKTVRIGSLENITQYDSADYDAAIETDQPIKAGTPVGPNDVLRLSDVGVSIGDVVGPVGAIDSDIVEFDGLTGKKIKDGGLTHANVDSAIALKHARTHSITWPFDHTSTATPGKILKADVNGLPIDATNTDAEVADAITKKHSNALDHTQGTDTALGALGTKNPPVDADLVVYRNSAAVFALVTSTWTQIKAFLKTYFDTVYGSLGVSHTQGTDTALGAVGVKNPPIDADKAVYRDSTAGDVLVTSTYTQIKAFLKTYFDSIYQGIVSISGQIAFPAVQVPSADANTLDDYDEYTAADASCTGALTVSAVWKLVKIGKVVTLQLPITLGTTSAATNFTYGVVIPTKYRPPFQIFFRGIHITDASVNLAGTGILVININGTITIYKDGTASVNFGTSAGSGLSNGAVVSWIVT
jgi:hypothetical protein